MIDQSLNSAMTMRSGNTASLGRIDQYEILRELGGGGFGTVYLAKDTVSGVDVAVKGLPPLVKNNKEELENIRQNFALVSRLHHPGIAAALVLHPAGKVSYSDRAASEKLRVFEGDTLMVMEYAPGVTLSQWRRQFPDRRVPVDKAIAITRQIADALDYAHERKIIHRDIKPSNVMIETSADGVLTARVLDFGLAAEIRSSMGRVSREVHDTSGTRPYMAPEQWSGERQGAATDQYALAVLFHELVTGEVPFASVFDCGDPIVMLSAITTRPVKVPNDLPRAVRNALTRTLGKEPGKRFDNCRQFVDALCPPIPPPPVLRTVVVALVLIVAIGPGAVVWHRHHQRQVAERLRLAQVEERRKADEASAIAAAEAEKRRVEKARAEAEARQRDEVEKERQAETAEKRLREELAAKAEKEKSEAEARAKAEAAERKRREELAAEKAKAEDAERKRQKELAAEKAKADEERRIAAEQERKREELRKAAEEKEREISADKELKVGAESCRMSFCKGTGSVPGFWISNQKVPVGFWNEVLPKGRSQTFKTKELSVENVTWDECQNFVSQLNRHSAQKVRLPSAAEIREALGSGIIKNDGRTWTGEDYTVGASAGIKCVVDLLQNKSIGLLGASRGKGLGLYIVCTE